MRKLVFTYCIHRLKNEGAKEVGMRVWIVQYKGKNQCMWEFFETQPLGSLRRRRGNSEIARNTLRTCKLDLTDSHFCRTVLSLRGSTTRMFTIFRCKLRGISCYCLQ